MNLGVKFRFPFFLGTWHPCDGRCEREKYPSLNHANEKSVASTILITSLHTHLGPPLTLFCNFLLHTCYAVLDEFYPATEYRIHVFFVYLHYTDIPERHLLQSCKFLTRYGYILHSGFADSPYLAISTGINLTETSDTLYFRIIFGSNITNVSSNKRVCLYFYNIESA